MNRYKPLAASVAAVAMLVAAGCSGGSGEQAAPPPPSPTPSTPSPQPPLTLAQYQALLTSMEKTLKPLMARAMSANTLATVDAARLQLAEVLEREWKILDAVQPPAALLSQHRSVQRVMYSFSDLRKTFSTAMLEKKNSCGLPKPLGLLLYEAKVDIYYTVGDSSFEQVVKDLAKARISFGKHLLPASPERPAGRDRRGVNGKIVQRSGARGYGRLQITNDDYSDAAISVVTGGDPKKPQATIYVRANSKATLSGIRGTYSVYIKTGTDWDAAHRRFTDNCSYESFLQFFDQRSNWKISLAKTETGNALSNEVPAF